MFAVLAALGRLAVQEGIETRYQILGLWLLAAIFEGASSDDLGALKFLRFLMSATAIAFSASAVKIALEGFPWGAVHRLI